MANRESQSELFVLAEGAPNARASQAELFVLAESAPNVLTSQCELFVLCYPPPYPAPRKVYAQIGN